MTGFLVTVSWTDSASATHTAIIGVEDGLFASAIQAINAAESIAETLATSKNQNPQNVTASAVAV